jgi:DNA-binding CsgD family transcriptional regulator
LTQALAGVDTIPDVMATAAGVLMPRLGSTLSAWSTLDPADLLGTSCHLFDHDVAPIPIGPAELVRERALFELEWLDGDPNTFAALRRSDRIAAALRSDVGDPSAVARYRELLAPLGVHDELRLLLAADDGVWGTVIFYRVDGVFGADDVASAQACSEVLARGLRQVMLRRAVDRPELDSPSGAITLDGSDNVVFTSPAAEHLLSQLDHAHADTALVAAAAGARVSGSMTTTIAGRNGVIGLYAAPTKGLDGGVTVIVERPRPAQLTPLILRALGLTNREREITECLLQGLSRRAIAVRFRISEETVDDHLGQIYRKADVPGRAALCASVFERFYEPHRHHADPSPYGWFIVPTDERVKLA